MFLPCARCSSAWLLAAATQLSWVGTEVKRLPFVPRGDVVFLGPQASALVWRGSRYPWGLIDADPIYRLWPEVAQAVSCTLVMFAGTSGVVSVVSSPRVQHYFLVWKHSRRVLTDFKFVLLVCRNASECFLCEMAVL